MLKSCKIENEDQNKETYMEKLTDISRVYPCHAGGWGRGSIKSRLCVCSNRCQDPANLQTQLTV